MLGPNRLGSLRTIGSFSRRKKKSSPYGPCLPETFHCSEKHPEKAVTPAARKCQMVPESRCWVSGVCHVISGLPRAVCNASVGSWATVRSRGQRELGGQRRRKKLPTASSEWSEFNPRAHGVPWLSSRERRHFHAKSSCESRQTSGPLSRATACVGRLTQCQSHRWRASRQCLPLILFRHGRHGHAFAPSLQRCSVHPLKSSLQLDPSWVASVQSGFWAQQTSRPLLQCVLHARHHKRWLGCQLETHHARATASVL